MSEWQAIETAYDHHLQVVGYDLCSMHGEGSPCYQFDEAPMSSCALKSRFDAVRVRFEDEAPDGVHDSSATSTVLLKVSGSAVEPFVEPLSFKAVLIPEVSQSTMSASPNLCVRPFGEACSSASSRDVSCSPTSASDETVPLTSDSAVARAQAFHDQQQSWLLSLRSLWRDQAQVEHTEEGRVLHVQTWYLHHGQQRRCQRPRPVRLDYMDHHWLNDLRDAWRGVLYEGEPLHLTVVQPTPPSDDARPFAAHLILSQGHLPQQLGVLFTVRFIEDHRTQLLQEAVVSPDHMCGTQATRMMRVEPFLQDRRWIVRTGVMIYSNDELEPIGDGIAINIDIQVPSAADDIDTVSLAAWTQQVHQPQPPVADMHPIAQQDGQVWIDAHEPPDDSMSENDDHPLDDQLRFCHLFRLGKRIFHGHLPWNNAHTIKSYVEDITGIPEDDIVILHHVKHGPQDLQAAGIEPLLLQVFDDLAIGSVHRMVLLDVEFHEKLPSTDVSVSRRCATLPHVVSRRALLSFVGIGRYCERVRQRCLVWHNHDLVDLQYPGHLHIMHGDYVRIAIPPWPAAPAALSTRVCVSRVRQNPLRLSYALPRHHQPDHEDGMTVIDAFIDDHRVLRAQTSASDQLSLLQSVPSFDHAERAVSSILASEISANLCDAPVDKIEDEHPQRMQQFYAAVNRVLPNQHLLQQQPPLVRELFQLLQQLQAQQEVHERFTLVVETWYSDPQRRPHSGIGRVVHLHEDFTTWMTALLFAWEDWIDPFADLSCHIVYPVPDGTDPEVQAHIIIVQHEDPHQASVLSAVIDPDSDPWHPRILCLSVPRLISHHVLEPYVDIDRRCAHRQQFICRSWWQDQEITHAPRFAIRHGAAFLFAIQVAEIENVAVIEHDEEAVNLIQTRAHRRQALALDDAIPSPVWVRVDCSRVLFLRTQLCIWEHVRPEFRVDQTPWHPETWHALEHLPLWSHETPLGFTFYTDGTASKRQETAAAAVVLIVSTQHGLRWGGYVTTSCLGTASAPRAEATALLLALRWLRQLHYQIAGQSPWVEFAFDCAPVAGVASGTHAITTNADLMIPLRALVQWLEGVSLQSFTWHHILSHKGHPWNEAADVLCRQALRTGCYTTDMQPYHAQCIFDQTDITAVQWLWLLEQSLQQRPGAPPLEGGSWKLNIASPLTSTPAVESQPFRWRQQHAAEEPRRVIPMSMQFGSANVLTLFPGQDYASSYFSARAEALAAQFQEAGLHVVGLQETRSRLAGHARLQDFHVISASATQKGVGGVQLWIRRSIRTSQTCLQVEDSHLYILHATSQRLIVRWTTGHLRLILCVLHAPTTEDEATLAAFWHATTEALPRRYRSWRLLLLADANSRVGSVTSASIGAHQAVDENLKGAYFHQWLLQHNLILPQTFPAFHHGEGSTWTHPSGTSARLDYIAIPAAMADSFTRTWVDTEVDLAIQRDDHALVRAQVNVPVLPLVKRKPPHVEHHGGASPSTWATDVHTHAATLQAWMRHQQVPEVRFRKAHLTDDTRKLIQAKKFHRKHFLQLRATRRRAFLAQMFDCWRTSFPVQGHFRAWLRSCDYREAFHFGAYSDLVPRVVAAVRADDACFYEHLAEQAGEASMKGARQLWDALKPVLPRWRAKFKSNLRCTGPDVEDKITHYNHLEAGQPIAYDVLLAKCSQAQHDRMHEAPLDIPLVNMPTRCQLETHMAKVKSNRAPGVDSITPHTLKKYGLARSDDIAKLFFKMWATGAEPLQFKGGLIHSISKKHKSMLIQDMRGIALLDGLGKLSHAILRAQMLPTLSALRAPLQLGGFPHQSTLFATHYLRAFSQAAAARTLSSGVLFLDIKSAFHSLIREIVFDMPQKLPPKLVEVLQAADISPSQPQEKCESPTRLAAFPQSVQRMLADAHDHTWFTVAASDEPQQTHRGSRPGSPLADAAFNLLMTRVLAEIEATTDTYMPLQLAFAQLGMVAPPITWIDDVAIPIVAIQPSELPTACTWVLTKVAEICSTFGLKINLKPTKTEAVIAFRGHHARELRSDFFHDRQGLIHDFGQGQALRCVPRYEHLGTIYTADGAGAAEIAHRVARAQHAHHEVCKSILRNRHLAVTTRLRLLEGLVVPVLFHGAGAWSLLTSKQLQRIQSVYVKWVRGIVQNGFWTPQMQTDAHLLLVWRLPTVSLRLAKLRLLYAFHLVKDCPATIIEMISLQPDHKHSWFRAVRHALVWLQSIDASLFNIDPARASIGHLFDWFRDHAHDGPRLVRRLFRAVLEQGYLVGRAMSAHVALATCFRNDGEQVPAAPPSMIAIDEPFECRLCAHRFATLTQMQTHLWTAHEVISPERAMMSSTTCEACHLCLWTAQRLQQHLRYSRRHRGGCYERLTWRQQPHVIAPVIDKIPSVVLFHRHPAAMVATAPSAYEETITSRADADSVWQKHWQAEGLPEQCDPTLQQEVTAQLDAQLRAWIPVKSGAVDDIVFSLTGVAGHDSDGLAAQREVAFCLWVLQWLWCSRFSHIEAAVFERLDRALHEVVRESTIGRLLSWKQRMDEAYQPLGDAEGDVVPGFRSSCFEAIVDPCRFQNRLLDPLFVSSVGCSANSRVPICLEEGEPVIWILHLFSGRRRVGDCHWWLEHIGRFVLPDFRVRLLSVDTAIDQRFGDLSTGPNLQLILNMARRGIFAAVLTGPPCETFSAARNIELDQQHGPRPLRTAHEPWCLSQRTPREMRQCDTGTELLFNSLQVEVSVVGSGGGALMEHPWEAQEEEKVSVWRLRCHEEWVMRLPHAYRHRIEQWLYGSAGVKPTCIRALHLGPPTIVGHSLQEGAELWRSRPTQGLRGRGTDGKFRTAKAKEYPSALCRSLIVSILRGLHYRIRTFGTGEPAQMTAHDQSWVTHMCQQSQVLAQGSYLPDYQGA